MANRIRSSLLLSILILSAATVAAAADIGGHIGYFDNSVKKPYIGIDLSVPVGPIAIVPNIDYWRSHGYGYWIGNGDVTLRFAPTGAPSFWVGAGPAYGFVTGSGNSTTTTYSAIATAPMASYTPPPSPSPGVPPTAGSVSTGGIFGNGKKNAWGWDVTGGVSFGKVGSVQPYVTGRYDKIKDLKAGGVAVGIRFGM